MANDATQYRQIILAPGYDSKTGVFGLVCSTNNGQTFRVYWTPFGRVWYPEDASSLFPLLWPLIEDKLKELNPGTSSDDQPSKRVTVSIAWDKVTGKPNLVTEEELNERMSSLTPTVSSIDWSKITNKPDLVTQDDLKNIKTTSGKPGKDGESAYQIAVDHGFVGSETDWLKSLHGKDGKDGHGGDSSLSIEAITDLIKNHLTAKVDTTTGQLTMSVDGTNDGSIADAVAAKIASSVKWKLNNDGELIAQIGGA